MTSIDAGFSSVPTLQRVAGHIGVDISGIDLSADLPDSTVAFLRESLLRHKVLFFRGQTLDHASHARFARRFGDLFARRLPQGSEDLDEYLQIWTISPEADVENYGFDLQDHYRSRQRSGIGDWHTDFSTSVNPPAASVLRCETVPEYGGDIRRLGERALFINPARVSRAGGTLIGRPLGGLRTRRWNIASPTVPTLWCTRSRWSRGSIWSLQRPSCK
ncbi:TauD/TfdA family dioxygenase [Streptomyces cinnamoneus]|uniref:TauD/TfdA dioxygenase family protein n=1 Tax=Streptomyces cinnamoneus TaxID=53446 RepID=UPI00341BBF82